VGQALRSARARHGGFGSLARSSAGDCSYVAPGGKRVVDVHAGSIDLDSRGLAPGGKRVDGVFVRRSAPIRRGLTPGGMNVVEVLARSCAGDGCSAAPGEKRHA